MLIRNLEDVQAFIDQKFSTHINYGSFKLSGNERCRILTFVSYGAERHPAMNTMKSVQKNIPPGLGLYERKNRFYFAPIMTAQQKLDFAEVEAWVIGSELLEHQKETITMMELYKAQLEKMAEAKRVLEAA